MTMDSDSKCAAIIVPTIREENITQFLKEWKGEFSNAPIFVVEDNPTKTFNIESGAETNIYHYSWQDVEADLGDRAWIIPRRTDCIRSYGFLKAYEETDADFFVTLDDDCFPVAGGYLAEHRDALFSHAKDLAWISTGEGMKPRGMPYRHDLRTQKCAINHGLWKEIPDFDAITQLVNERVGQDFIPVQQTIPRGRYFPMCGMNLAVRREVVPAWYFLLMGKDYQYDRFGDIWAGIFLKRICDHLGYLVRSGEPMVRHDRASNVWNNLRKESPGLVVNEELWQKVDNIVLEGKNFRSCYRDLAEKLPLEGSYWKKVKQAMCIWTDLFPEQEALDSRPESKKAK